jgi:outer membrane protein assembly factor BamA
VHQSYDIFLDTDEATRDSLAQVLPSYFDNAVGLSLTRDTRDDRVTPNRGSIQTVLSEVAGGPLRGPVATASCRSSRAGIPRGPMARSGRSAS